MEGLGPEWMPLTCLCARGWIWIGGCYTLVAVAFGRGEGDLNRDMKPFFSLAGFCIVDISLNGYCITLLVEGLLGADTNKLGDSAAK